MQPLIVAALRVNSLMKRVRLLGKVRVKLHCRAWVIRWLTDNPGATTIRKSAMTGLKYMANRLSLHCGDNWKRNTGHLFQRKICGELQFAKVFPDKEIVVSLIRQLSWTHILVLIPLE